MQTDIFWISGVVILISIGIIVLLFGELAMFKHTPIQYLHTLVFVRIPRFLQFLVRRMCGEKGYSKLVGVSSYFMYDKHPFVQVNI